jgi:hypothetical protein
MTTVANILVGLAVTLTVMVAPLLASIARLAGPDRSGSSFQFLFLAGPRWFCLAIVLAMLIQRDTFGWIADQRGLQWLTVIGLHAIVGVISVASLASTAEDTMSPWLRAGGLLVPVIVPLVVCAYALVELNPSIRLGGAAPRIVLGAAVGVSLLIGLGMLVVSMVQDRRNVVGQQEAEADKRDARYRERLAELNALSPTGPLGPWLRFLGTNEPEDIHQRALAAIMARPRLSAELAELLQSDWCVEALRFIDDELRSPPTELAIPAADGIRQMAQWVRTRTAQLSQWDLRDDTFAFETQHAVGAARKFGGAGADFGPPLRELLAALDAKPGVRLGTNGSIGRRALEEYLRRGR